MHGASNLNSRIGEKNSRRRCWTMMAHRSLQHQVADGGVTRPAQPEPAPQNMLLDVFCVTAGLFNTLKWSSTVVVFFAPDIWCSVVNWNNVEFGALRRGTNSDCFQRGSGVLRAPCSCQHGPSGLVKIVRVRACMLARACVRQTPSVDIKSVFTICFRRQRICHLLPGHWDQRPTIVLADVVFIKRGEGKSQSKRERAATRRCAGHIGPPPDTDWLSQSFLMVAVRFPPLGWTRRSVLEAGRTLRSSLFRVFTLGLAAALRSPKGHTCLYSCQSLVIAAYCCLPRQQKI